jgi:hypothetical protein
MHQASVDADEVAAWWARWPDANVAIATGALVVFDIDGDRGARALCELEAEHGPVPETPCVSTGCGRHLYFLALGLDVRNSAKTLGPGLDVRGRGGYAIAPPSRHANGHIYRWHDLEQSIATFPLWLAELTRATGAGVTQVEVRHERGDRYLQAAIDGETRRVAGAQPGTRNDTLNRAAFRLGQLAGAGLTSIDALRDPLLDAARNAGLADREALATIASGLTSGALHPRAIRPTADAI